MESGSLATVVMPLALALMMFSMGLALRPDDFRRVLRHPRAIGVGLGVQIVGMPALAVVVAKTFALDPVLAAGLVITAACPAAVLSNVVCYLGRGDAALSISMTACGSLIALFTVPLMGNMALGLFTAGDPVQIPVATSVIRIFGLLTVPILAAMAVSRRWPAAGIRMEPKLRKASGALFFVIVVAALYKDRANLGSWFAAAGTACIALLTIATLTGHAVARSMAVPNRARFAIAVEVGMQNVVLGLVITETIVANSKMSAVPAMYGILMLLYGALQVQVGRWQNPRPTLAPPHSSAGTDAPQTRTSDVVAA